MELKGRILGTQYSNGSAALCAETEKEKEENRGEEGSQSSLDSYSQLTDYPKSRRWGESGGEGEKCLHFMDSISGSGVKRCSSSFFLTLSGLSESDVSCLQLRCCKLSVNSLTALPQKTYEYKKKSNIITSVIYEKAQVENCSIL